MGDGGIAFQVEATQHWGHKGRKELEVSKVENKGKYGWNAGPSGRWVGGEFDEEDRGQIA